MIIGQDFANALTDVPTQMLIAPVLPTMVSDRAYAVGEQFIVNSVLYKITQAVSGADVPLVVDTNCEVSDTISQQTNDIISLLEGSIKTGSTQSGNVALSSSGLQQLDIIPTAITGFTPIGVISYYLQHYGTVECRSITFNGTKAAFFLVGPNSYSDPSGLVVRFLYVKNDLVG